MKRIFKLLQRHRFRMFIIIFVLLAVVLGVAIVPVESRRKEANIKNAEDGVWWAVTTMTGVGYGDRYPITTTGRSVAVILEVCGVVVFGLIAGQIAVELFRIQDDFNWKRTMDRLGELDEKMDRLEKKVDYLVKSKEEASSN